MKRIHLLVDGTVQGVGFRYTLQRVATDAGATGWVRNLRDGRVEAEIEGTAEQVEIVRAWAAHGPRGGQVTSVAVTDRAVQGTGGFEIRRDA